MTLLHGHFGRYLRVDLERGVGESREIPSQVLRQFIGGAGLGAYLLFVEEQATVDPLSADSCLAFVFSPLVGSPLTTSAKFAVVCKSPLTNRFNDSLVSSGFAISGKQSGFDAIVLRGRCDKPTIVVIEGDQVRCLDASHVWGRKIDETEETLRRELGTRFRFAVIGPAGEQRVKFATISHDGRHAGRGGTGAVMGAKNVKAIAVAGDTRAQWADPRALNEYAKDLSSRSMGEATEKYRELGTAANLLAFNRLNVLPSYNFQQGSFPGAEQISVESLRESRSRVQESCAACTIGCEHLFGLSGKGSHVRVEYESLFALGALCGVSDPDEVLSACLLCDEYGLDTISTGGTIALAMECVQRGLLKEPWLKFGDGAAVRKAIESMVAGEGIGLQLAEGSKRLEAWIGPAAEGLAAHVKGLELPGYEPRGAQTMALGFAVGARGADHNRSGAYEVDFSANVDRRHATIDSVRLAIETEDRAALIDSLILCKFLRRAFPDLFAEAADMLKMTCGWDVSANELRETSQRIVQAKKLFNIHAGWQPSEDRLPSRFLDRPLADDPKAVLPETRLRELVKQYYHQRGWSDQGWMTDDTLQRYHLKTWDRS